MMVKGSGKRILLVEDEVRIALSLRRALEHPLGGGHIVEISPSANAALIRLQQGMFDLLITDLKMSGMSGMELIQRAREIDPSMRAILITAFNSPTIETRANSLSAAYIRKPFSLPKFITTVQDMLNSEPRLIVFSGESLETIGGTSDPGTKA